MARKKDVKIILDTYGNYLGMEKGCIILRDKQRNESRYPLIENTVSEIVLNSGNMVSARAKKPDSPWACRPSGSWLENVSL
jgi:hypothetical protein